MKKLILFTLLMSALSANAYAQNDDPQKSLEQAAKAGACIEKLDQNLIQEMTRKGQENQREIEKLCAAGKRKEAQAKMQSFYQEGLKDPLAVKLKACTAILFSDPDNVTTSPSTHVCDDL